MKFSTVIGLFALSLLLSAPATAQRILTLGVPDIENFNSLGTGNVNVSDGSTIPGFYSERTVGELNPNLFTATADPGNTPGLYNFGSATLPLDRAAGTLAGAATGTNYLGLHYINTTSFPIGSISVTYTGEQWRDGNGAETLAFSYQIGNSLTSLTAGAWTTVASLNFAATNFSGTGARDGNAAINRAVLTANIPVNIPVGGEVMLRWADNAEGGQATGFGIDDVSVSIITVSAGESSISGEVATANGSGIRGASVTVQGGDLDAPKTVVTSASGGWSMDGLTVGQTYFVSVIAKKYTFADAVQTLYLTDDSEKVIFRATK